MAKEDDKPHTKGADADAVDVAFRRMKSRRAVGKIVFDMTEIFRES